MSNLRASATTTSWGNHHFSASPPSSRLDANVRLVFFFSSRKKLYYITSVDFTISPLPKSSSRGFRNNEISHPHEKILTSACLAHRFRNHLQYRRLRHPVGRRPHSRSGRLWPLQSHRDPHDHGHHPDRQRNPDRHVQVPGRNLRKRPRKNTRHQAPGYTTTDPAHVFRHGPLLSRRTASRSPPSRPEPHSALPPFLPHHPRLRRRILLLLLLYRTAFLPTPSGT